MVLGGYKLDVQIKDLYTYVWKKNLNFFVNYDKWLQQSRNFHCEALKDCAHGFFLARLLFKKCFATSS